MVSVVRRDSRREVMVGGGDWLGGWGGGSDDGDVVVEGCDDVKREKRRDEVEGS